MPLISRLIGSVAFLSIAMFSADAALRDQTGSLDWQRFKVPEYGTNVDYPARIFAAVGEAEKGVGQRFESNDGRATLSIYARANARRATHRPVISGRTYGNLASIMNGLLARSLRFPWNGTGPSTTADAISRVLQAAQYTATPRTRSGIGTLW
jgi:hypothetical protein